MMPGSHPFEVLVDTLRLYNESFLVPLAALPRPVVSKEVGVNALFGLVSDFLGEIMLQLLLQLFVEVEFHYHVLRHLDR